MRVDLIDEAFIQLPYDLGCQSASELVRAQTRPLQRFVG